MHPKKKMPAPREKSFGTKAGKNATAYTAAFTLVMLVIKPRRKDAKLFISDLDSKSNLPNSFLKAKSV